MSITTQHLKHLEHDKVLPRHSALSTSASAEHADLRTELGDESRNSIARRQFRRVDIEFDGQGVRDALVQTASWTPAVSQVIKGSSDNTRSGAVRCDTSMSVRPPELSRQFVIGWLQDQNEPEVIRTSNDNANANPPKATPALRSLAAFCVAVVCATGCSVISPSGDGHGATTNCLRFKASLDISGSRLSVPLSDAENATVRSFVRRAFLCGGHADVSAFSGSVATTVPLYSGELHLDGATDNARLRREPKATEEVMTQIHQKIADAVTASPRSSGTDILGQLGLVAEYGQQLDNGNAQSQLVGLIVTDGEDTDQLNFADPTLTAASAVAIADAATVPDLSGAQLTIIGIGKSSSGAPAATAHVDAVKAGWNRICERTNAAECTVVTDPANGR